MLQDFIESTDGKLATIAEEHRCSRKVSFTCATTSRHSPRSLRAAMAGMTDPQVSSWSHLGIALARENTDTSDNAQGVTTDGAFWYVVANGEDGLAPVIGVYDNAHQTVKKLSQPQSTTPS